MKRFGWFAVVMWVIGAPALFAGLSDFDFTSEAKVQDRSVSNKSDRQIRDERWAYNVVVWNKSAKDYGKLEFRYIIFRKQAMAGSKSGGYKRVRSTGSVKASLELKSHDKFTFTTDAVDLKKSQLQGGWTYANGAPPRTYDGLEGIWIRVFDGDKQVGEFVSPQGLDQKERWDAPTE